MIPPLHISRRVRRRVDRSGISADVAADVNLVVSTGGTRATSRQQAPIRQGRRAGNATPAAPDLKEEP